MIWLRPRIAALAALALGLAMARPVGAQQPAPAPPALSDEAELARAVNLYEAGRYDECAKEFTDLLGNEEARKLEQPDVVERGRVYYAACLIATGKKALAEEQFRLAIRANPMVRTPDSLIFPPPVIDLFLSVKDSLVDEIRKAQEENLAKAKAAAERAAKRAAAERARVRRLEEYARQQVLVTKNRRWLALVPFGVGQFQNDDPVLGWIFLSTEVLLAGTALTAVIATSSLNAQGDDTSTLNTAELNQNLDIWHQVFVVSSWGFLAVATTGIVQAQLAFKPEFREIKKRPLPRDVRPPPPPEESASVSIRPAPLPVPGGGGVGIVGRF